MLAVLVDVVSRSNGFGFRSLIPSRPTLFLSLCQVEEVNEC